MQPLNNFLQTCIRPAVIGLFVNPIQQLISLLLWVLLMIFGGWQLFEFIGNSWFNGGSALASMLTLGSVATVGATVTAVHDHVKQLHQRQQEHTQLIQALHEHVRALHDKLDAHPDQ
jgi:hypothetical protein